MWVMIMIREMVPHQCIRMVTLVLVSDLTRKSVKMLLLKNVPEVPWL